MYAKFSIKFISQIHFFKFVFKAWFGQKYLFDNALKKRALLSFALAYILIVDKFLYDGVKVHFMSLCFFGI